MTAGCCVFVDVAPSPPTPLPLRGRGERWGFGGSAADGSPRVWQLGLSSPSTASKVQAAGICFFVICLEVCV